MIFPFRANGDSASSTVQELIQSRITLLRPQDQNTYFKGEEAVGKRPYDPLVLHIVYRPEAAGLTEGWSGF